MGGSSSEVSGATRIIALEAAYWEPMAVRRASRRLGLHTEASHRFERHSDPEAPLVALSRIAHLLERMGAGTVRPELIDVVPRPIPRRTLALRQSRVDGLLGVAVTTEDVGRITAGLGFEVSARSEDTVDLVIPSWRNDVSREVDVIEEVGRHIGLEKIPSSLPPADSAAGFSLAQRRERRLRQTLAAAGFSEVINLSFVRSDAGSPGDPVRLKNPLSEDDAVLRGSLILPGLLDSLLANVRQGRRDLALFEIGRVFEADRGLPREPQRLALLAYGALGEAHWSLVRRPATFFDLKGVLETVGDRLGVRLTIDTAEGPPAHLHPDLRSSRGLRDDAILAEIDIDPILLAPPMVTRFASIVRFPTVERDLSALCPLQQPAAEVLEAVREAGGPLLRSAEVTSRFDGPPVPEGFVSLTMRLRFQDASRTLTSDEVQSAVASITRALRQRGSEIRGE
jgi:phenylalanyl-tRNA synthetase beta chain